MTTHPGTGYANTLPPAPYPYDPPSQTIPSNVENSRG